MSRKKPSGKVKQSSSKSSRASDVPAPPSKRRAIEGMMRHLTPNMDARESELEAAQAIIDEAFEANSPRQQMALARQALAVSPDCADAYVLLAEYAESLLEARELYEQGVAAGERALGSERFREYEGHFWGFLETRPYMRARAGLANCLWAAGERAEATEHFREMLRLNPNDNQGIRYCLASMLLRLERHEELEQLLDQYDEDGSAEWDYAWALMAFRCEGDSADARQKLSHATETNPHVPAYLAGVRPLPRELPEYITLGGEDEAIGYAAEFLPAWKDTPGAISWLRKTLGISPVPAKAPSRRSQSWPSVRSALAQLPLQAHEEWQVDLRGIAAASGDDGDGKRQWLLLICSSTGQPLLMEPFADRPRDGELLSTLAATLNNPTHGDPRRPGAICISRKAWLRSWKAKLEQIGIDCRLSDTLEMVDRCFADLAARVETTFGGVGVDSSSELDWSQIGELPQQPGEQWQAGIQRLATWMNTAGEPSRPWARIVVESESDAILSLDISPDEPGDDWLLIGVWQALCQPAVGPPHRPEVIHVATDRHQQLLAERLEHSGVRCIESTKLEHIRHLAGELADHLAGNQHPAALLASPGVTPEQIGRFFAAAADFYRARPWRKIPGDQVIQIHCDRYNSGPWYAVVMGQSGIEQGLALYEDLAVLQTILSGEISEEDSGRRTSAITLMYGEAFELAPQDLDGAEEHGWAVAGPEAYPHVLRVNPGLAVRTPLQWELELIEGCLRVIPLFLDQGAAAGQFPATFGDEPAAFRVERMPDRR